MAQIKNTTPSQEAQRETQISTEFNTLRLHLENLEYHLGVLISQIAPVLSEDEPALEKSEDPTPSDYCPLAVALHEKNQRLREISDYIHRTYVRIEL